MPINSSGHALAACPLLIAQSCRSGAPTQEATRGHGARRTWPAPEGEVERTRQIVRMGNNFD